MISTSHQRSFAQRKFLIAVRHGARSLWLAAMMLVLVSTAGFAQSVWIQGGTSTVMQASGGELAYRWGEIGGFLSMGYSTQLDVGAYTGFKWKGYSFGLGDRYQPFTLDTDNFESSRYFYGRGVSVSRSLENRRWTAFGGVTALQAGSILYRGYRAEQPTGAFFYEGKLADRWTFHSTNLAQDGITSLQSLRYQLREGWSISTAAGVGSNHPYAAASTDFTSRFVQANGSYVTAGDDFRRVTGTPLGMPERIGVNLRLKVQPARRLNFTLDHAGFLLGTEIQGLAGRTSSLDSAMVMASLKNFSLSGIVTASESGRLSTRTQSFTASRNVLGEVLRLSGTMMHQRSTGGWNSTTYLATADEKLSPRLRLQQTFARTGNSNAISGGAQFVSNPLTFGVNHQIAYTPLAGAGASIVRAWTFNVNARIWDSLRLHVDSYIDPSGRVRYTAWLDGIHFGSSDNADQAQARNISVDFGKFVVKGIVLDEKGEPVWGIAIQVDGKMAYTDSMGRFLIRFRRGETYPVTLLAEQSLSRLLYHAVEIPVSARAETENIAPTMTIRVRRAPVQPTAPPVRRKRSNLETDPLPEPGEEIRPGGTAANDENGSESNENTLGIIANMHQ